MENHFYKAVDKRSREELVNFLQDHERYAVMSSWNCIKTFANNVKVHHLAIPRELQDRAYELVGEEGWEWRRQLNHRIRQFQRDQHDYYTIGFNGRSGGYLLLLGKKCDDLDTNPSEYHEKYYWSMDCLRSRVGLVQDFDRMCDIIREDLIYHCRDRVPLLSAI